jgi:hypothetical protein
MLNSGEGKKIQKILSIDGRYRLAVTKEKLGSPEIHCDDTEYDNQKWHGNL